MLTRAAVVTLLASVAFVAFPSEFAAATFAASASGLGQATLQSIPVSAAPVAVVSGREVTLSWSVTTLSGGTPAAAYTVRRYDTSNVAQTVLDACITVAATTCVEHNVPSGTWTYSAQALMGSWTGAESAKSAAITVAASSFVLDSTAPITSLPATVTGTISSFSVGETLTYHLDSTTGSVLSGSPSTVTSSASMAVSVTVPAGTSDAPHSLFVVGSGGSSAAAAINIVIPPVLQSMQMRDVNGNGKVDQVTVVFDDTLAAYTAGVASWTLTNVPSGGSLSSVSVGGNTATLTIAEGAGVADTAVGSFTVALATNSAGIRDVNNHPSSFAATAPTDVAAPALVTLNLLDNDGNGKVDTVTALFSELLQTYSAATTPWTLTNVPSGGTLSSVASFAPATLALNLTPGAGAVDTTVGAMTVAMATNILGARDAAGNLASFAATAPLDKVAPVLVTLSLLDSNGNGKVDRVTALFSETLAGYTAANTPWTLANVPSGGTLLSVAAAASTLTLTLTEGAGAVDTTVGSMTVAMATNAGGARDAAANLSSFAATAPLDKAGPALVTLSMLDNNGNGKVDRVTALFSETLAGYTAANTPWTLANVPSGGTLLSVAAATSTITLTLTEGAGAANTTVGTMTVAMATNAGGARDAAANLSSFAATAPLDKAGPAAVTISTTNAGAVGRAQTNDTIVILFSEPLAVASVPTSTAVILTDPNNLGNDTLTMAGVSNGAGDLGSNLYITANNTVASFASAVALITGNTTIRVTLAACTGAGCSTGALASGTATGTPLYSFVAATTLTDVAGNLAATQAKTQNILLF